MDTCVNTKPHDTKEFEIPTVEDLGVDGFMGGSRFLSTFASESYRHSTTQIPPRGTKEQEIFFMRQQVGTRLSTGDWETSIQE